MGKRKVPRFLA